jgi:TPR repeat protein
LQLSLSCVHAGQSHRDGLGVAKDGKTAKGFFLRAINLDPDFPSAKKALSTVE